MLQNTNKYSRIFAGAFVVLFVTSVIFYFFPSAGNVKWLDLSTALEQAPKQNKPILLYPFNKFATVNKLANKAIFSNDTVVKFIYDTFIPAKLDLDEKADAEMAKKRYLIDNGKYSIVLDKYGRGIIFLDNSWSSGVFHEFAKKSLDYSYFKFLYYDDAKAKAISENKPMLIFVTNNYYQNISINERLQNDSLMNYINGKFIPVAMMSYEEWDRSILKKYLNEDDPIVESHEVNLATGNQMFKKSPSELILIISPTDDKLLGRVVVSDSTEDWIVDIEAALEPKVEEKK
jgi:hypothetical protein